jgi:hypothetical protein
MLRPIDPLDPRATILIIEWPTAELQRLLDDARAGGEERVGDNEVDDDE